MTKIYTKIRLCCVTCPELDSTQLETWEPEARLGSIPTSISRVYSAPQRYFWRKVPSKGEAGNKKRLHHLGIETLFFPALKSHQKRVGFLQGTQHGQEELPINHSLLSSQAGRLRGQCVTNSKLIIFRWYSQSPAVSPLQRHQTFGARSQQKKDEKGDMHMHRPLSLHLLMCSIGSPQASPFPKLIYYHHLSSICRKISGLQSLSVWTISEYLMNISDAHRFCSVRLPADFSFLTATPRSWSHWWQGRCIDSPRTQTVLY